MPARRVKKAIHVAVPETESVAAPEEMNVQAAPVEHPPLPSQPVSVTPPVTVEASTDAEAVIEPNESITAEPEPTISSVSSIEVGDEPKSHSLKWLVVLLAFIFGVIVGGAGLRFVTYYFDNTTSNSSTATPTPAPTSSVPTPTSEPKRSDLKVVVLNGSGKTGAAASAKQTLETLGYVVADTGNADEENYAKTQVTVRKTKKILGELLVTDLKKTYEVDDLEESDELKDGVDAIVIVGKK